MCRVGTLRALKRAPQPGPRSCWRSLQLSRTVEGIGFVLIVVAAPSLIAEVTNLTDIKFALAGWSAYMPGGVALGSLLAPLLLKHHTWRSAWQANAILLVLLVVFIAAVAKRGVSATSRGSHGTLREMKRSSARVVP